jgi:hypothetical protein
MIRADDDSTAIFASDGSTIQRLYGRLLTEDGPFILTNEAGASIAPWEVELLRWPPEDEAALKRSGYLSVQTHDTELWCNCAD